jgi:hypothetical protein
VFLPQLAVAQVERSAGADGPGVGSSGAQLPGHGPCGAGSAAVDECLDGQAQFAEPAALQDLPGPQLLQVPFLPDEFGVQAGALDVPVAVQEQPGGRHLPDLQDLLSVVEVLKAGVAAEAVRADAPVELVDQLGQLEGNAVDGDGQAVLERHGQGLRLTRSGGGPAPGVHLLRHLVQFGIVEDARLELPAPQVGVAADDAPREQPDARFAQLGQLPLPGDRVQVVLAAEGTLVAEQPQCPVRRRSVFCERLAVCSTHCAPMARARSTAAWAISGRLRLELTGWMPR